MKSLLSALKVVLVVVFLVGVASSGVASPQTAQAQESGGPLLFVQDGDLWTWSEGDSAPAQLTQGAHIHLPERLTFGPDGTWAVVPVLSPVTVDALERVGGFSGTWPTDIALVNLQTGALVTVATQPDDARLFAEDGQPDSAILRSEPVWSPDGTAIAWTELHYPSFAPERSRLMTYQLLSGETREIANGLPEPAGAGPSPLAVYWGAQIAVTQYAYDPATGTFPTNVMLYSSEGVLLTAVTIPDDADHRYIGFDWLHTGPDSTVLGLAYTSGAWDKITLDGKVVPVADVVEQVSALVPGSSLATRYTIDPAAEKYTTSFVWQVRDPLSGQLWSLDYHGFKDVLIAPDGRALAYLDENGTLMIWRDGTATATALTLNPYATLWWGPLARQVAGASLPAAIAEPVQTVVCDGALPPRLSVGGRARVVPGTTPNNVRNTPSAAGSVLGQIPAGGEFAMLDGPVCADSYAWWQVDYNGLVGWTVEGDAAAYWLELLP